MKVCTNCNRQSQDSNVFCPFCAIALDAQNFIDHPHPPAQQPYAYPPTAQQPPQDQPPPYPSQRKIGNPAYLKLGGWLAFSVVVMTIIAVIYLFASFENLLLMPNRFNRLTEFANIYPESMELAVWISFIAEIGGLASGLFAILFLVQIYRQKPYFMRYFQLMAIVNFLYAIFAKLIPSIMVGYEWLTFGTIGGHIASVIEAPLIFFLWTLYYCKSVRVRTYMGSDEYMDKAIFAFFPSLS